MLVNDVLRGAHEEAFGHKVQEGYGFLLLFLAFSATVHVLTERGGGR